MWMQLYMQFRWWSSCQATILRWIFQLQFSKISGLSDRFLYMFHADSIREYQRLEYRIVGKGGKANRLYATSSPSREQVSVVRFLSSSLIFWLMVLSPPNRHEGEGEGLDSNCHRTEEEKQAWAFAVQATSKVKFVNNEEADPAANLNLSEVCIFSGAR